MCQSPIYRDTHFYLKMCLEAREVFCVNPLSIGTPISTYKQSIFYILTPSVNPLSIGTPISTGRVVEEAQKRSALCQSPIYRDTHFYLFWSEWYEKAGAMCQSPIYRDTHFYTIEHGLITTQVHVSIPYLSGHPFLPAELRKGPWRDIMCQSPIYRDTHFYHFDPEEEIKANRCVNPLSIGTPISTIYKNRPHRQCPFRVNPLSIGAPISTLTMQEEQ